ncbi:MAG: bifunctional enoyl-CoA hydratase/phosphate acetyltransferase [Nitrospirota bacterium]
MDRIRNFSELMAAAKQVRECLPPYRVAVCAAEDNSAVTAMETAARLGLARPILIGEKERIQGIIKETGSDPGLFELVDVSGEDEKAEKGVRMVRQGEADILMKGMVPTSTFLHPIFRKENGLSKGFFISHCGVLHVPGFDRLIIQTDGGINIAPDLEMKKGIIANSVFVARRLLNIDRPKVALLSASEKVHPKIQSTIDAKLLAEWAKEALPEADVEGPLALDLAVSEEAAKRKGITGAVAGLADILVSPNIEMGNVIYKALRHFANASGAGIVVGAGCPIILTSRSDPPEEKINALALAVLYAGHIKEAGYIITGK